MLKLSLASAAVLAVTGGSLALLQPGLRDGRLSPSGSEVFRAVGRAFLDGSLPKDEAAQRDALAALHRRIDALITGLPAHARSELSQLLALLASSGGRLALTGIANDWAHADVPEIQRGLESMRTSRVSLRRQAYQALHDITGSAYFSEPATWHSMGYPGPMPL